MKIIEVPVFNEDGSLKFTQVLNPEETQVLLQFAVNFLLSQGLSIRYMMEQKDEPNEEVQGNTKLN